MELSFHISKYYDVFIINGEINITSLVTAVNEFSDHIKKNEHKNFVLDLSNVEYIDSSGLRMFVNLKKKIESNDKKMYILNPSENVARVFSETKTDKVFEIIDSLEKIDKKISDEILNKYKPYTIKEDDLDRLKMSCPICGSSNVTGYLVDLNGYDWGWTEDDPFPTSYIKDSKSAIDMFSLLPAVCMECYMSSIALSDFSVLEDESIAIKSNLDDHTKLLLSKTIKKRKKMMQLGRVIDDAFFEYPRSRESSFQAYLLAEFCARTISISKGKSNPFLVGYLNYWTLRYAQQEQKAEFINNCRTWFTQALNQIDDLNNTEIAISCFSMLISDINLEKYEEGSKIFSNIKERKNGIPSSKSKAEIMSPLFWYDQAIKIWEKEIETKSKILKISR